MRGYSSGKMETDVKEKEDRSIKLLFCVAIFSK